MDAYEITETDLQLTKEEGVVLRREMTGTDPHHIKGNMSLAVAQFCDCTVWRDRDGTFVFLGAIERHAVRGVVARSSGRVRADGAGR
jgi:hypothetical protein